MLHTLKFIVYLCDLADVITDGSKLMLVSLQGFKAKGTTVSILSPFAQALEWPIGKTHLDWCGVIQVFVQSFCAKQFQSEWSFISEK